MTEAFRAPWGRSLAWTTILGVVTCVAAAGAGLVLTVRTEPVLSLIIVVAALAPLAATLPFMIRGYAVTDDAIVVYRLGWVTQLPRDGLQSVTPNAAAVAASTRVFGNGGLFSWTGRFRSPALGDYRAFVTDWSRAVILRYARDVVVLSPDRPEQFVESVGLPVPASGAIAVDGGGPPFAAPAFLRFLVLVPLTIGVTVGVATCVSLQPVSVVIADDQVSIDGGVYEAEVRLADVVDVTLEDRLPAIRYRSNGFAAAGSLRGNFVLVDERRARLFVERHRPPFVAIRTRSGLVVFNFNDPARTRAAYERLTESLR
jgi:hypothetical protein